MSVVLESCRRGHRDVIVILEVNGLHRVEGHIGQDHQVLTQSIPAVHCKARRGQGPVKEINREGEDTKTQRGV